MPTESAYHEAGHVVVAHALGVPIVKVELDGVTVLRGSTPQAHAYSAAVSMGGGAAEARAMGYNAEQIAEHSISDWAQDMASAAHCVGKDGVKLAMRLARKIIHRDWAHVETVAEAIEERGTLTGDEVTALLST